MSSKRMLNGILKLGDLEDVESFAHRQARSYLSKKNIRIPHEDYEDLISFIFLLVWDLYDSKWNGKDSFAGYATYIVSRRITDHFRDRWGRNGEKIAINQAMPISQLGDVESTFSQYDKADSLAAISGLLV